MKNGYGSLIAVTVVSLAISCNAYANGYKILGTKSAKAIGMGEAFVVQADDPSSIAFNPAGLAQLRGEQVNGQVTLCNAYAEHTSTSGAKTDNVDSWQPVPSFFFTTDLGRDDMAVGLGVSLPNGLSSEWEKDSFARYVATYSDLVVADISPSFGFKANDRLMVGVGADYYYSEAKLESVVDSVRNPLVSPLGLPQMDMDRKLEGSGSAWGCNIGMIYRISDRHGVALVYRTPYTIDYDGTLTLAGAETDIEASIDYPAVIVAGYAFRPSDKLVFEVDLDWTDWAGVGDITLVMPDGSSSALAQDLENTIAYKFGAQYQYSDALALRCGYIYNERAMAEETWRPSLIDTDVHFFTFGAGYTMDSLTIDAAVQLVFYEKVSIENNVDFNEFVSTSSVDGDYKAFAPCVSLGATYRF